MSQPTAAGAASARSMGQYIMPCQGNEEGIERYVPTGAAATQATRAIVARILAKNMLAVESGCSVVCT